MASSVSSSGYKNGRKKAAQHYLNKDKSSKNVTTKAADIMSMTLEPEPQPTMTLQTTVPARIFEAMPQQAQTPVPRTLISSGSKPDS